MDPEERLWFFEQAILCFLAVARQHDYLGFENALDPERFIDLEFTDTGITAELGLCECTCRHLGLSATASSWLTESQWHRDESDPWSCYGRSGPLGGIAMARLVEMAFIRAYELPVDFAVVAIFEADAGADALVRILNFRASGQLFEMEY
jgi:hypothetical protein